MNEVTESLENLPLSPKPRELRVLDGSTELCPDIRLATSDVLPFVRKSMRGILSAVGIRVVANKKKFVVQVSIVSEDELEMDDVPEGKRGEYYELDIVDNLVKISSATQQGAVWGTHTYAQLYGVKGGGSVISNLKIRDWADNSCRGIYLPATSGIAWMRADEIYAVVDRIAREKLNLLALGLYGQSWSPSPGERILSEYLFHPFQRDEAKEEIINPPFEPHAFRWYSPKYQKWLEETYYPRIIDNSGIDKIATYVRENSLRLVPAVSFFAKSPLLISVYPELAGKTADGEASDEICCLSSSSGRKGCEKLVSMLFEQAMPKGADDFMLELNSVPSFDDRDSWCQCEECKDKTAAEVFVDSVISLVELLFNRDVSSVVLSSTDDRSHQLLLDSGLLDKFNDKGMSDKIVIHAEDPALRRHGEGFRGAFFTAAQDGEKMPVPGQVTELISQAKFTDYSGVVANSSPAAYPAPLEAEMGAYLWNTSVADSTQPQAEVLEALCPQHPEELKFAVTPLLEAIETARFMKYCDAVLVADEEDSPLKFAVSMLRQAVDGCGEKPLAEMLAEVQDKTAAAWENSDRLLEKLAEEESPDETLIAFLQNNAAEAIRLGGISHYLNSLLPYLDTLEKEDIAGTEADEAFKSAGKELINVIEELEKRLSTSVAPRILHQLSSLL